MPAFAGMTAERLHANVPAPYLPASTASSSVLSPVRGALTSTAMLPGLCSFFHIIWWARGISSQGKHVAHAGIDAAVEHELVGG